MKKCIMFILVVFMMGISFSCKKDNTIINDEPISTSLVSNTDSQISSAPLADGAYTDSRQQLQALINSYASKKQVLKLEARQYIISDELYLPSNASIEGMGSATEIILSNGSKSGRNVFKIGAVTNTITLKNLKINANQQGNTGADLVGLFIADRVGSVTCDNVTFSGGRDRGVVQIKGTNGGQSTNLKFLNCKFPEAGRTDIELRGTRNVIITNCLFENWGQQNPNSPAIQLQSQDNYNVQITNNKFNNKYGVQFAIECAAAYVYDSKISGNQLNDPVNLGGNGISGYYKRTEISSNIFTGGNGFWRSGLEIFGQNNNLINNKISAGSIAIAPGLNEEGANITIKDNTITNKGTNSAGIQIGNGAYRIKNVKVLNNIVDTRAATGNSSAVVVGTYGKPQVVQDVTVEANTLYTNAHCIRLQSLPGSKNIYLNRDICKAGASWLGVITNTFTNIQAVGNIKELSNKQISYSVAMTPIVEK